MADIISEIVAPNVNPDLDGLINKLISVEKEIDNINGRIISVTVDVKGVESLNQLNALAEKQTVIYTDLNKVRIESAQATQQLQAAELQYGAVATGSVRLLVEQKQELQHVNDRIKELNSNTNVSTERYKRQQEEIVRLTAKQIELKTAIAANSKELKENIVQVNNTSNSFNVLGVSGEKIEGIFARMAIRMVGAFAIFEGGQKVIEVLGQKFNDLADNVTNYENRMKSALNTLKEFDTRTEGAKNDLRSRLGIYSYKESKPGAEEERKLKILESQALAGKEAKENNEKYLEIEKEIYEQKQKIVNKSIGKNEEDITSIQQYVALLKRNGGLGTATKQAADLLISQLKEEIKDGKAQLKINENEYNKQGIVPSKTKRTGMLDEIELEKANSRARLDVIQETYDKGRKTFAEEKQLHDDQRAEAQLHYNNLIEILNKWKGKVGETREKYLARVKEAANEEAKVDIKTNEEDAKIQEQIIKRHIAAGEAIDAEIDKLTKLRGELDEANAKLDETRRTAKSDHDYASGFGGVLEGIGFDTQTGQNLKNYDIAINRQKGSLGNANEQLANEGVKGSGADPAELLKLRKKAVEEEDKLSELEAQRQAEIDNKILEGKKELGRKMVEAIRGTFDAIQTIQDNAFAYELQQNQIKQDQLQINKQQRLDAIEGETKFAVDKENEKSLVVAQSTAKQNELIKESQGIKIRQAKFDKEAAELKILVSTATAIAETYATYSGVPGGILIATGIAAALAALGAAQYAAAASAPLPQFAMGGTTTTSDFIAGEAGVEIIQPIDKPAYFTGSTAAAYHEKPGAKVISNKDIVKYAADNIGRMDAGSMQAMYNNDVITKELAKMLGAEIREQTDDLVTAIAQNRTIIPGNTSVSDTFRISINLQTKSR